ncbi:hypothetical protein ZIOFF_000212 [Zingiber officinale]|uniref:Receptor kinase-like protein Xa21 n=2 Tax=Zingiber officinale TaxID=94328 RepID=A0A8J5M7C8_ZINOF|nr:hypothetical protein ZIOFF_000212 [Zingiber officinale]
MFYGSFPSSTEFFVAFGTARMELMPVLALLLLCLLTCHSATDATGPEADRAALLEFRAAISHDPRGFLRPWNATLNFCRWPGVACADAAHPGRVSSIDLTAVGIKGIISPAVANLTYLSSLLLPNNTMYGEIPPELGRLAGLSQLNLSYNELNGTLPASLDLCFNLTLLDLSANFLSGAIPVQFGSNPHPNLRLLSLAGNRLTGGIPLSLGRIVSLRTLDLSYNKLTGEIPSSLGDLLNVSYLDLSFNQLNGGIPTSFANLYSVGMLCLSNNQFTGTIPSAMRNLTNLWFLDLSNNSLSGEILPLERMLHLKELVLSNNNLTGGIPDSIGGLVNLTYISLSTNDLTGKIPPSITNLSLLRILDLAYNHLEGRLPEDLGNLKTLSFLQVSSNNLSGNIPQSLFRISNLDTLSMAFNNLKGTLPDDIGDALPNLRGLGLAYNQLEGPIPASLNNAVLLEQLDISSNNFSGKIPRNLGSKLPNLKQLSLGTNQLVAAAPGDWDFIASLSNCTQLEDLNLMENQLAGELPASFANLSRSLNSLTLGRNRISGNFPATIRRFTNLVTLGLNENQFTGPIPDFLGELIELESLILYDNKFTGTIPPALGDLIRLNELFLNGNFLTSTIPAELGKCQNLNILDLSNNQLTGSIPHEVLSIEALSNFVDMSNNYLSGPLPQEIGNLRNLQYLSFYNNSLSGRIPSTIGECQVLEYLNLSRNFFEGTIPRSLADLKGLIDLDLSHNNLSGPIPEFLGNYPDMENLNLSYNSFSGEMPSQGLFLNSSEFDVEGNRGICGGIASLHLPSCPTHKSKKNWRLALAIALPVTALFLCIALFTAFYVVERRRRINRNSMVPSDRNIDQVHTKVSYTDLLKATDDFSPENLIGVGSYGSVYRGSLGDEQIAVKVLDLEHRGAFKAFIAECEALRNIRHRNLVKMLTACVSIDSMGNEFRAILFEFMPNGSLENWLHPEPSDRKFHSTKMFGLVHRLNVAIDVGAALNYLHDHYDSPIIHCDLKPSNVLLDANMTARVGDFGIARFLSRSSSVYQSSSAAIKGSIGYMAPEYGMGGLISTQADVYSYGILLLELFTGRRPTDEEFKDGFTLQKYVERKLAAGVDVTGGVADPAMFCEGGEEVALNFVVGKQANGRIKQCLESVLMVGLCCAKASPAERITMADAVTRMETIKNLLLMTNM